MCAHALKVCARKNEKKVEINKNVTREFYEHKYPSY